MASEQTGSSWFTARSCDGPVLVQQREVIPKEEIDDTRNTKDPRIGEITEYT